MEQIIEEYGISIVLGIVGFSVLAGMYTLLQLL